MASDGFINFMVALINDSRFDGHEWMSSSNLISSGVIDSDDDEMDLDGKRWFAYRLPMTKNMVWILEVFVYVVLQFVWTTLHCREQEK